MSVRLYIGNLPKEFDKKELEDLFAQEAGESATAKLVTDRKTGKCRGFGFVTVETDEQADQMIEKLNGYSFKENALKIEKALPKTKENASTEAASTHSGGKRGKGKNRNGGNHSSSQSQGDSFQPDPRWAQELEKLKEMLLAQTNA